ncbi:glutathione S-transferase [Allostella vacuolata]|nr:glutathione S-transferase [Stella vacuolata]
MYRLYYSPGACSLAARIVLEETGAPYEAELVSAVDSRMTETPAYRQVNPKARVPALWPVPGTIGARDAVLTEVGAIMVYLARTYPEAGLLPADPAGEARCLEWLSWLTGSVHGQSYGQIWRAHRFTDEAEGMTAVKAKGMANLADQHRLIESVLADGRGWAVPGGYSIADPYLHVFYRWGGRIGLPMAADYPAWTRLDAATTARPAVRRALAAEGLTP